jgi:antirestriction protein ArdC
MDIYAIVTEKIINLLEQGVVPWRRWVKGLPNCETLHVKIGIHSR